MILKSIKFKNILSFGNNTTEIKLDNNKINLISGLNGHGKSSIIDAINFVLTGKAYRNINKNQLINTTNRKELLVELLLECKQDVYVIKRGLKPSIFEIYKNGNLLNQSSTISDYQMILNKILKINIKTFKQSIIMSSKFYKPFLEMSKSEKRNYIEDVFNISMFSNMNGIVKEKNRSLKQEQFSITKDLERVQSNLILLDQIKKKQREDSLVEKQKLKAQIKHDEHLVNILKQLVIGKELKIKKAESKLEKYENLHDKYDRINSLIIKSNVRRNNIKADIDFLRDNNTCNKCSQIIDETFKQDHITKYEEELRDLDEQSNKWKVQKLNIKRTINKLSTMRSKIEQEQINIYRKNTRISVLEDNIRDMENRRNKICKPTKTHLKEEELLQQKKEYTKKLNKINELLKYYKIIIVMLADNGIKKYIIKKYLTIFNKYVNKYLRILDTTYRISFDEEFNETIIASNYKGLQYGNFSGGERQRLDLAILFGFLEVAKTINSINCNLLMLDEVADSALDGAGIVGLFQILDHLKQSGYTTYIISHRTEIKNYCDRILNVDKKKFSNIG
jgi:DNA repair exonuclease SbcCD ATPase subunit